MKTIEGELSKEELRLAKLYWEMFVGNPIGEHETCGPNCGSTAPNSGILTNDPVQTEKAARIRLELGVAEKCPACSRRHLIISEALSHHSELLRCTQVKDSNGAIQAARRRCASIQSLSARG